MTQQGARSIARTFGILEVLADLGKPQRPTIIAQQMDLPLSSVIDVLKGMVSSGYLILDPETRTYAPSPRITLLADRLAKGNSTMKVIEGLMNTLVQETEETIVLAVNNGLDMEVISIVRGPQPISLNMKVGYRLPVLMSALGMAFLASLPRPAARKIIAKALRTDDESGTQTAQSYLDELAEIARSGVSSRYVGVMDGVGAIASPLLPAFFRQPLSISIGGPSERIKANAPYLTRVLLRNVKATTDSLRRG